MKIITSAVYPALVFFLPTKLKEKRKFMRNKLSVIFILSILLASITFGVVDATENNATWITFKNILGLKGSKEEKASLAAVSNAPEISIFKEELKPVLFKPTRLYTTNKEIDVLLEEVTVEEGGILGTPSEWNNGGWYKRSAKPGEDGNIIIDGHYDTSNGSPAAFWGLKNLEVSDKVFLVDEVGRNFEYQITELIYVDIQDSNRIDVLNESEGSTLTLITCGGVWLPSDGTYNKRLIVKAQKHDQLAGNY